MDKRFHTDSRISENFTEDGLEMITGQDKSDWLTYIAKELIDNSLEACENPKIEITCWIINKDDFIQLDIKDNGPGIAKRRINKIFKDIKDFGGTKRHYKLPTRGSQGNALMSIFGIQSLYNRPLQIHSNDALHKVSIMSNDLRGEPEIQIETKKIENIKGLKVSFSPKIIDVPDYECGLGDAVDIKRVFLNFIELNPQAEIKLIMRNKRRILSEWKSEKIAEVNKLTLGKKTTTGKVSWFSAGEFLERLKADIRIEPNLLLKDFIGEFYGFSSPAKVQEIMTEFDHMGGYQKIEDFLHGDNTLDETAASTLYETMKLETNTFREDRLATTVGSIGREGMKQKALASIEILQHEDFSHYHSELSKNLEELDLIVEFASAGESKIKSIDDLFFYCGKGAISGTSDKTIPHYFELIAVPTSWNKENRRSENITFGINQSFIYSVPGFPFSVKQRKGNQDYQRIDAPFYMLRYPFKVVCNLTCPTINYRDRGKQLFYAQPFLETMQKVVGKVIRKIESDLVPILNRMNKAPEEVEKKSILGSKAPRGIYKDFVFDNFMKVYNEASDNGKYILTKRQFYYAIRRNFLSYIAEKNYKWDSSSTLDKQNPLELKKSRVDGLIDEYEVRVLGKRIMYRDTRGFFTEPFSNRRINLSTVDVGNYTPDLLQYNNLLFVEKAGFFELLHDSFKFTKRYDLGLISSKGWATLALRDLVEHIQKEKPEIKLYTLTDLDIAGVGIKENVKKPDEISVAEAFNCEPVGLKLEDVEMYNLEIEPARYSNSELSLLEHKYEADEIEKDLYEFFKKGQRVEINVFTPVRLREYLETRFKELRIEKLKPEEEEVNTFEVDSPAVFYRSALWDAISDYISKTESSLLAFLQEKVQLESDEAEKKLKEISEDQQKIIYEQILEELKKFPPKNWVAINDDIVEEIETEHEKIKREYETEIKEKAREILEEFVEVQIKIIEKD